MQKLSREAWPDELIGWKVGGVPAHLREVLGADHVGGPIYSRRFFTADAGELVQMPVFAQGYAAVEPEFVVLLGDAPEQDRVFIGIEMASSPIVDINAIGSLAVVCDFGNNNGVLVGPEIMDWRDPDLPDLEVSTRINDTLIAQKTVSDIPFEIERARGFLTKLAQREGFDVPPGTYISTGAITGVHKAHCGDRSRLDFGRYGALEIELIAERPWD